jgi:carbonic anhydrase
VRFACENKLDDLPPEQRDDRFVEMNVLAQMLYLRSYPEVANAVESRGLKIHGVVYDRRRSEAVRLEADLEQPEQ